MMKNNFLKTFFLLSLFLCGVKLSAQPPLKARPLNVFTLPGQAVTINVLDKSELGACGVAGTGVIRLSASAIPGTLQHGTATVDMDNNIVYTPSSATFHGQDSLKYVLTCGAKRDTAVILINVSDKPEVVKDVCAIEAVPESWEFIRSAVSDVPAWLYNYISPLAGDIDGDGRVEIIASGTTLNRVYIFKGDDLSSYRFMNTVTYNGRGGAPYGMVRWNGIAYLIVPGTDRKLYAYDLNGGAAPLWTSTAFYHPSTSVVSVGFADFDADGKPEIYVGNSVFDLETGSLIAQSPDNSGMTYCDGQAISYPIAADVDNDGVIEYVAGNQVYSVNFAAGTLDLKYEITGTSPDGSVSFRDGRTQVVDWDADGYPDIVVSYIPTASTNSNNVNATPFHFYIWDTKTLSVKSYYRSTFNTASISIPMIGDINGDRYPDLVFVTNLRLNLLTQDQSLPEGLKYEYLPSSDQSGFTGATLFDFNQDGISEIVYRDETDLRIINASYKVDVTRKDTTVIYNLGTYPLFSSTWGEYPIVIDPDGSGASKIVCIGHPSTSGNNGQLCIFESANNNVPWAPARPVWNQYAYNPVYVNDDLTIPAHPLNPVTKFVTKDGTFHQPFNNFLQQATLLNEDGEMLRYGPRLTFDNLSSDPVTFAYPGAYGANSIDVSFSVSNIGDAAFPGPLDISAYLLQGGNFVYLGTHAEPTVIAVGTSVNIGYTIDFSTAGVSGDQRDFIQLRLNDRGNGIGADADPGLPQECNYSGHFSRDLFGAPDYPLCGGEEAVIYFYPQNNPSYTYVWYDTDPNTGTPTPVQPDGESYTFIKSPSEASEVFYVNVYDRETMLKSGDTYTVKTFLVPDTLVWTAGGRNNDWNDPDNWFYPGGPDYSALGTDVKYKVPGSCTNVEIPSPALLSDPHYPDLKEGETAYPGPYTGARCNRIWYRSGGETARTDSLHYNLAYVDLTLDTHRWYMISAPLKSMYTGDYYIREQNPYRDERMYEPMFFNVTNPQTMETPVVAWTGRFHNADLLLAAGQGMAIWYDKTDEGYTYHDPVTSSFPKPDIYYGYYAPDGHAEYYTGALNRDGCNRFIYEPLSSDGTVPLSPGGQPGTKDVPLLIGNPFMSHLDMERFLSDNDSQLYGGYKLASGVASVDGKVNSFISYQRSGESWFSTDPDVQDLDAARYIAPMQSFIVVPKADAPDIRAHVEAMTTLPSGALRSAAADNPKVLDILAVRGEERSRALILYPDDASDAFDPGEDSYRLFPDNNEIPLLVYTRSADGYALDINSMKTFETRVPLGLRSSLPGTVTLIFSETAALGESATVYLYDMKEDRYTDLSEQNEYTFTKQPEDPLYLEDRFRLYLEPKAMGLSDVYSSLSVTSTGGSIEIVSGDGGALRNIRITDVQGRILSEESNFMQSRYRFRTPGAGLYIVRVANEHSAVTKKIMVR